MLVGVTQGYAKASSRQRWLAIMLIVALHGLGVLCWPKRHAPSDNAAPNKEMALTFVTMPAPIMSPATPAPPVPAAIRQPRKPIPPPLSMRLVPAPPPLAVPAAPVPAPPERSAADMMLQAKRDVGKIDRELRSASLDMAGRHLVLTITRRERAIAAPHVGSGPPQIVEEVMNDGSRPSRIGNMCAQMESNTLVGARDVFRDGVKTRWAPCWKQ